MLISLMATGLAAVAAAVAPQPVPKVAQAQIVVGQRLYRSMAPALGCVVAPAVQARDRVTVLLVPRPGHDRVDPDDRRTARRIAEKAANGVPVHIGQTSRRNREDNRIAINRTLTNQKRAGRTPEGVQWVGPQYVVNTPHCPRIMIFLVDRDIPPAATAWAEAQQRRYGADRIVIRHAPPGSAFPA